MIARFGERLSRIAERIVPDPFVLALLLTLLVAFAALGTLPAGEVAEAWMTGFAAPPLLAFALQMCLVLVTGHALATSPPVQSFVRVIATMPRNAHAAAFVVSFVSCAAAIIHWGLGAIVGAFLAREMGRHARESGLPIHYPLLGAAAYGGMAVWHGGLSGSAPLKVAEAGHFAESIAGVISVDGTLFGTLNLVVTGGLLIGLPLLFMSMVPGRELTPAPALTPTPKRDERPSVLAIGAGVGGLSVVLFAWLSGRVAFDLNLMNFVFLFLGLTLQANLKAYADAIADGARGAGAIILQFPFYFGILGVMKAAGFVATMSEAMVGTSKAAFAQGAFLSAGLTNLFVPSGGGQWAIQGEVLLGAADRLGVAPQTAVMAFSYGDAWTNMLQPFWALPLLGIMGLRAKDIVGYTAVAFLAIGVYIPICLAIFG